jgi:GNAT superfamily N-acetyltransferase
MPITIRDAQTGDAAFIAHGNIAMAEESEHKRLDPGVVAAGVDAVLSDRTRGRYFIAERDGQPVGQLMITCEWSDWRNGVFWWIQSVYVVPEARRAGVFRALFRHVERLAREDATVCGIRLYVAGDNERAQATYRRCGLEDANYRVMEVDYSGAVQPTGGT